MRSNLPVTQNEIVLRDDQMIVSKTDLKGQITFINKDFLDISGFTEAELMGQPHNIVRHPDMPEAAFADLWRTLKDGRPWIGMVKNRCKNGDFYWVEAHATPLYENNQVVGYMSVRKKPTRQQIDATEPVYRQFRENRAGGMRIELGGVVSGGGMKQKLVDMSIKAKLGSVMTLMALLLLAIGALGLYGINTSNHGLQTVYEDRTVPLMDLGKIIDKINLVRLNAVAAANATNQDIVKDATAKTKERDKEIAELWTKYVATTLTPEEKLLADAFSKQFKAYQESRDITMKAAADGNFEASRANAAKDAGPKYAAARETIFKLIELQGAVAKEEFVKAQAQFELILKISIGAMVVGLLLAVSAAVVLIRAITGPLNQASDIFAKIGQGMYSNFVDITKNDETGKFLQNLEVMQIKLGFDVSEAKRIADENLRIKIALDNVSTGVMIADNERSIIYANKSVQKILKGAESAIRQQLPQFDADRMVGVNIDSFHKNPAHQANLLATFTSTYVANLEIGGRYLRVSASPVMNARNERLGAVAEWLDRTPEVLVEKEVAGIVEGALRGDFVTRLSLEGKEGFFRQLAEGLNQLSNVTQTGLSDVARVLQLVAAGDLTQKIETDYQGIFGQLKDDTNTTIERLREVVGRIKEATEAINIASQEIAAGNQDLSSRTEEQASSLEETSSSMEELNATVKQNAENAKQANELAKTSNAGVVRGGEVVKQVVVTMGEIQASSKKISDIIGVIDSIAFQTNILALNAAVEAARAGEQGRGFAVVATEVRNLAQRSATAAKEIKTLIAESVDKVESGAKLVQQAGTTMDEVVTSFQQVASLVTEIASASREQSSGIEQTTQAVSQMDEVTQQNAALVEEAAAAAESLEEQARGLVQTVSMFKLAEGGGRTMPASALRDATPRQLAGGRPQAKPTTSKKVAPPHLADAGEQWEEF
ncbi:methyl-accepting chemotaxis protein [Sulfuritalea hydrogenivorans]|uniref:PAS domain S-box n=1 Tax=Sulfuritalea hydrogenivorans sk43H TaxID=1223802 RepID=W0SCP0_9PROT|nr:methyl-accepting chemotaxis protein [Sulfuritalea hydrogenivorans]BAO28702.1 PAS domain S-box [Sulfuritalea hydrogenivorans sk43H]